MRTLVVKIFLGAEFKVLEKISQQVNTFEC